LTVLCEIKKDALNLYLSNKYLIMVIITNLKISFDRTLTN